MERPLIAVLDYGIGNLRSAQKALAHVGADARLTADRGLIADAAGVVLPGVGAFGRCAEALRDAGLADIAAEAASAAAAAASSTASAPSTSASVSATASDASVRPFLAICIGLQLLFASSEEDPGASALGVLPGAVRLLPDGVKRPQMQWNTLFRRRPSAMLDGLPTPTWVYFVHSFAADTDDELVVATCDYGGPVPAALERGRLWATQFHPEKSGVHGLGLLSVFVAACGGPAPDAEGGAPSEEAGAPVR